MWTWTSVFRGEKRMLDRTLVYTAARANSLGSPGRSTERAVLKMFHLAKRLAARREEQLGLSKPARTSTFGVTADIHPRHKARRMSNVPDRPDPQRLGMPPLSRSVHIA